MKPITLMFSLLFFSTMVLGQNIIKVKEGDKSKMKNERGTWVFKDKLPDGHYLSYRNNDTLNLDKEIIIKNGKKNGLEVRYYSDGKTKYLETNWKDGKRDGITTFYGGNGDIRCIEYQVNFTNDIIDGPFFKNAPVCSKEYSGYYKNGIRDSIWYYYEIGDKGSFLDSSNYWLAKIYKYTNGLPTLISAWNKEGVMMVKEGNGVIIDSNDSYTTTTHYSNGLKNGVETCLGPIGDTIYSKTYYNDILIRERLFEKLDITSDTTSYIVTGRRGPISYIYPAHSYLYSISEWIPSDTLQMDTTNEWIDTYITDIYYKEISSVNNSQKNGFWAIYFESGVPAVEGNYLKGKRIGEWKWKYPSGTNRLIVNYDKNTWQHIDTNGTVVSDLRNEYITSLTANSWWGDNFLKKFGSKEIRLRRHYDLDYTYIIKFFLDGKVGILAFGNSRYYFIGDYYLQGESITLNIKDEKSDTFKRCTYKVVVDKRGGFMLKK